MASPAKANPISIGAKRAAKSGSEPRRRVEVDLPDDLTAGILNELGYFPRLFFNECVEGIFTHCADTVEGAPQHEKLETKSDPLSPRDRELHIHSRSITLSSETHRLTARMDLIESEAGLVVPVSNKNGSFRDTDDGPEAWPANRVQLCVEALSLRDNRYRCDEALAYYHATRQRVRVAVDDVLVGKTLRANEDARTLAPSAEDPAPSIDSSKCPRCSLVGICLPDETALYESLTEAVAELQLSLFDRGANGLDSSSRNRDQPFRRIIMVRDGLRPLYVTGHGLIIGKTGEVLQSRESEKPVPEGRVGEVSQVNVFGNVQFTATELRGRCWAEKPIARFSDVGWFYGLAQGLRLKNALLRTRQFNLAEEPFF